MEIIGSAILAIAVGVIGAFILQGLRKIPAEPPHIAVVTFLGKRTRKIKREGWRFFPLYPFLYGAILVDMTKKNQDLPPQVVRTIDLAELQFTVSLTWTPNENYAIEYLNHGGETGIKNVLSDMVRERMRQWAISSDKGTKRWEYLLDARDEATASLIDDIVGLPAHPAGVEHDRAIQRIKTGNGVQSIPQLGITLNRLNITEIRPIGELARTAERLVKEQQEIKGVNYVAEQVQEIMSKVGCTYTQAIELLQTERGKVSKKIQEIKGSVSDDVIKAMAQIIEKWQQ